jgi:hypothetical protein
MNLKLNEKIVYDKRGRKKDVIIAYPEYRKLMELVEDLDDIQEMKVVVKEETVPWEDIKARRNARLKHELSEELSPPAPMVLLGRSRFAGDRRALPGLKIKASL